jgi:hypothetical protein
LGTAISVGQAIWNNRVLYVPSTITGLQAALTAAQAVYADDDATVAEVSQAQTALIAAIALAKLRPVGSAPAPSVLPVSTALKVAQTPEVAKQALTVTITAKSTRTFAQAPRPKVKGQATVGKKVKAKVGAWVPAPALSYQWYRGAKAIKNATKASYKVRPSDLGKRLSVKVTAVKAGYGEKAKRSAKTVRVMAR